MLRNGKKWIALLLTVQLLLGLTACGTTAAGQQGGGTVYLPEFLDFDLSELGVDYVNGGCCDGTYVYMLAQVSEEVTVTDPDTQETYTSYESRTTIFRLPLEGGEAVELENYVPSNADAAEAVDRESYFYIDGITAGNDGTLWVTETLEEYIYDVPEDFDPDNDYIWNYDMLEDRRTSVRRQLGSDGSELSRTDTDSLEQLLIGDRSGYVGSSVVDSSGNTYAMVELYDGDVNESKVVVLDKEMNVLFEIKENNLWGDLVLLGDGLVGMNSYVYDQLTTEGQQLLRTIDLKQQTWGEAYPMPSNVGTVYAGNDTYLFYYDNGDSLYGFDAKKEEGVKLLTWSSVDINRSDLSFFAFLADGRVAAMTTSWGDEGMEAEVVLLTEHDASVLENQTILTFATMYLDYSTRERIIDFNKSQTDVRIEIRDYSEFNTSDDYNAGLTKLNTEIIAGQVPDILDTSGLNIRQYGGKGLLEDLWPYIEADEEIGGRAGVMENVLQAAEQDGALYQIFNSFTIRTLTGAADVVGDRTSWTLADLDAALAKMPEGCAIFSDGDTKEGMLSNVISLQLDNFVDWDTGECRFDSQDFISLLEFCDRFPLTYDWSKVDYDDYDDEYTRVMEGRQLLVSEYIYDFQTTQVREYIFGGDISYVGYPREDGGVGSSFNIDGGMAMSTTCKDKEAAWSFMRSVLLPESEPDDEYFYFNGWGFPVNRQDFEAMARREMTPEYMLDENGDPILDENGDPMEYSQGGYGWGYGQMVEVYAASQEHYDKILALCDSINTIYSYDESIYSIVLDVAKRYFNDDITVQAAADQIQSRVKLYVNENL